MQRYLRVFGALSSEQRLIITTNLLEESEFKCYCELEDIIDKDRSVIYRHFKALEDAGILETRKRGKRLEGRVRNPEQVRELLRIAEEINDGD